MLANLKEGFSGDYRVRRKPSVSRAFCEVCGSPSTWLTFTRNPDLVTIHGMWDTHTGDLGHADHFLTRIPGYGGALESLSNFDSIALGVHCNPDLSDGLSQKKLHTLQVEDQHLE